MARKTAASASDARNAPSGARQCVVDRDGGCAALTGSWIDVVGCRAGVEGPWERARMHSRRPNIPKSGLNRYVLLAPPILFSNRLRSTLACSLHHTQSTGPRRARLCSEATCSRKTNPNRQSPKLHRCFQGLRSDGRGWS